MVNNKPKTDNKLNLYIPEDMKELNIVGGAVASTPYNIRLVVYNEEFEKNGEFIDDSTVKMVRTAKAEIVMHPQVAKNIAKILENEVKKYEDTYQADK